ncbi:MAG: NlpC/P60 family protein [Woeseiaceae bacterium]|nr:NlpC/P60 family protein [Woeseiaceae bacterium]
MAKLGGMISQHGNRIRHIGIVAACLACLPACSSSPPVEPAAKPGKAAVAPARKRITTGERAAAVALQQVGVPYRYGGSSPRGFDCSGLVHYSYASAGLAVPRTTSGLWQALSPIGSHDMRVGDLLFFRIEGRMSHVGLYLGNRRFVHAPSSGKTVTVESLDSDYYRKALIRAGRP